MSMNDKEKEGSDGESGECGKSSGDIQFRYQDILSDGQRDDVLPKTEIKRLLVVHQDLHKERVDKQKLTRKERKAMKEGRVSLASNYHYGMKQAAVRGGRASSYKSHPLTEKAQFSGIDRQVNFLPTENQGETNLEIKDKLENRYRLQHAPKFNPKPRPY